MAITRALRISQIESTVKTAGDEADGRYVESTKLGRDSKGYATVDLRMGSASWCSRGSRALCNSDLLRRRKACASSL